MKLSVIIVNYNVKYFLEQCLLSVQSACKDISAEIIVVDNNSVDGSIEMLEEKFPDIHLIANKDNTGFSKANNQALEICKGEYALLLNPDTVVQEDTFSKCIHFMDENPEAGGLGVKMVDGKGVFLPESKRGLPTPAVAFYKIFGLSRIFPKSKRFGQYHLSFLDKEEIHEIEVLSGAYMFMRKSVLDKIGFLDETFFMYGEDIDLSYRIILGGSKNYYFPKTSIIHYKGESTKKGSLNYVFVFYNAMIIFAKKHFSQKNAAIFSFLINLAIYLRAGMSILGNFVSKAALPAFDITLIYGGFWILKNYWEANHLYVLGGQYPNFLMDYFLPAYIVFWLGSVFLNGGYDRPISILKILKGVTVGSIAILVGYALLSEEYRTSRALIILGSAWTALSLVGSRMLFNAIGLKRFQFLTEKKKRVVIIGDQDEFDRVNGLLHQTLNKSSFIGKVSPTEDLGEGYLGSIYDLKEIIRIYQIEELIFCSKNLKSNEIIALMSDLQLGYLEFKIAPTESQFIIGSNSINATGELYTLDIMGLVKKESKRAKRIFDIISSLILLLISPILFFFVSDGVEFIKNIVTTLFGQSSWVGFHPNGEQNNILPKIKKGVLYPTDNLDKGDINKQVIDNLNLLYYKEYQVLNDFKILIKSLTKLGRKINLT